jgi:hypothetical protein
MQLPSGTRYMQVLAPLNNETDLERRTSGGSHWSLLAMCITRGGAPGVATTADAGAVAAGASGSGEGAAVECRCYHLNSMAGSNRLAAAKSAQALRGLVSSAAPPAHLHMNIWIGAAQ